MLVPWAGEGQGHLDGEGRGHLDGEGRGHLDGEGRVPGRRLAAWAGERRAW